MKISPEVVIEVKKRIHGRDVQTALEMITKSFLPLLETYNKALDRARVHMAAIKRAKGDIDELESAWLWRRTIGGGLGYYRISNSFKKWRQLSLSYRP